MNSYRQDSSVGLANTSFGCHTTRSMSGGGGSAFGAACSCSSSGAPAPAFGAPAGGAPVAGGEAVDGDGDCASGSAAACPLACASLATRQTSACTRTPTVAHVGAGAAAARPALTASVAVGVLDAGGPSCKSNANESCISLRMRRLAIRVTFELQSMRWLSDEKWTLRRESVHEYLFIIAQ